MSDAMVWWLLGGALVVLELITGTFYLLMLALGMACAALAAHAGQGSVVQMVVAGISGAGSVLAWHVYRLRRSSVASNSARADLLLDIGSSVHIPQATDWRADGTAAVKYRGAEWTARLASGSAPAEGGYVIEEVQGQVLVLRRMAES